MGGSTITGSGSAQIPRRSPSSSEVGVKAGLSCGGGEHCLDSRFVSPGIYAVPPDFGRMERFGDREGGTGAGYP